MVKRPVRTSPMDSLCGCGTLHEHCRHSRRICPGLLSTIVVDGLDRSCRWNGCVRHSGWPCRVAVKADSRTRASPRLRSVDDHIDLHYRVRAVRRTRLDECRIYQLGSGELHYEEPCHWRLVGHARPLRLRKLSSWMHCAQPTWSNRCGAIIAVCPVITCPRSPVIHVIHLLG